MLISVVKEMVMVMILKMTKLQGGQLKMTMILSEHLEMPITTARVNI